MQYVMCMWVWYVYTPVFGTISLEKGYFFYYYFRSNNQTHIWPEVRLCFCFLLNSVSCLPLPASVSSCSFRPAETKPSVNPHLAIYSAGEFLGCEAARTVSIHIIAERWRHAPAEVTPQVLKSSLPVFFFLPLSSCLSFISSPPVLVCIHLPCLFICTISLLITSFFHLLSNDLWDQFDPQTQPPPTLLLSVSLSSWLPFFPSLILMLILLPFLSLSLSVVPVLLSPYESFSPPLTFLFSPSCSYPPAH